MIFQYLTDIYGNYALERQYKHSRIDFDEIYNISAGTNQNYAIERWTAVTCGPLIKIKVQHDF